MADARRVALLARPGEACERLRAALREAGGEIVLEADPSTLAVDALTAAAPQTVLVALEPAVEDALERFDAVLGDPGIAVIFDEADLAAHREGWDAARWVRHLAAKLHRHHDVLPPGREPEGDMLPSPGRPASPEQRHADAEFAPFASEAASVAAQVPREPEIGEAPAAAESVSFSGLVLTDDINELSPEREADTPRFLHEATDFSALLAEVETAPAQDSTSEELSAADLDALLAQVDAAVPATDESAPGSALEVDFGAMEAGLQELEAALPDLDVPAFDGDAAETPDVEEPRALDVEPSQPVEASPFGNLSLAPQDDAPDAAKEAGSGGRYTRDIADLERRISAMELVDTPASGASPAAASPSPAEAAPPTSDSAPREPGAVLILAGIGGPDAVRQILAGLPTTFARPVLVAQRLDGGRYDRLVQQMARAASLPVRLAEAGASAEPGHVYVVPPELGVVADGNLRFIPGLSLPESLPAAGSAILLLSGAEPAHVDIALAHAAQGALVAGQSPEGCYDAAAPTALASRGGQAGAPSELVQLLLQRWPA